jgi:hypothetical protein
VFIKLNKIGAIKKNMNYAVEMENTMPNGKCMGWAGMKGRLTYCRR